MKFNIDRNNDGSITGALGIDNKAFEIKYSEFMASQTIRRMQKGVSDFTMDDILENVQEVFTDKEILALAAFHIKEKITITLKEKMNEAGGFSRFEDINRMVESIRPKGKDLGIDTDQLVDNILELSLEEMQEVQNKLKSLDGIQAIELLRRLATHKPPRNEN